MLARFVLLLIAVIFTLIIELCLMENNTYLNNEQTLANCFGRCLANVIFRLSKKFFFDASTLEALAADGIEYAARIYLNANTTTSLTEKNLTGLANWKAEKLAADLLRRQQHRPEHLSIDGKDVGDEGEEMAESPQLARAALRNWQNTSYDRSWRELGDYAYRHLDEMFDSLNLNPLRRTVFREIYLLTGNYPYDGLYMMQHFMNNMFNSADYQRLSAAAVLLAIVIIILIALLFFVENIFGKDVEG